VTSVRLVQLSDLHFGARVDLAQIAELERLVPGLAPTAVVIAGDLTQRARHGEFQRALAFVETLRRTAPVLVVPGNHDTAWWTTPFDLLGAGRKHAKYLRYFPDPGPVLPVPGAVLVGLVSAHGLAAGSVSPNPRDLTVKGHLPESEIARAAAVFAGADPGLLRVAVLHHNVLRGEISRRMGLAHWKRAQRRLPETGADLVLCGHDHQESVGTLAGGVVVAASGTHADMTRGKRPSAFNLIEADARTITIAHQSWDAGERHFRPSGGARLPRRQPAGAAPSAPAAPPAGAAQHAG
jgi:3',5'-cyclic AMP phosphodiesterase CpdA